MPISNDEAKTESSLSCTDFHSRCPIDGIDKEPLLSEADSPPLDISARAGITGEGVVFTTDTLGISIRGPHLHSSFPNAE